ncbi:MAG: VanZ family protein [Lachnospiraceae bacterium]|nr:VanZ family protein [Lachnospiraceae bacterium]
MRLRTFLKPLSFIPALLLMYMIYQFSAQEADVSTDLSYKVSHRIVSAVNYVFDTGLDEYQVADYAWRINGITRKLAHMTEYFFLAIAMSFPLYVYGLRGILLVIVAGGICVAFACGDEYHQSFVAGRAASYKDVGIDSFGILVGIILVRIIGWTGRHTLFTPVPDDRYEKMTRKELKRYRKKQQQMEKDLKNLKHEKQMQQQYEPHPAQPYGQADMPPGYRPYDQPYERPSGAPGYRPYNQPYERPSGAPGDPVYYGQQYGQQPPAGFYDEPEKSSDELSEDMPLSRLLKPKK